MPTSTIDRRREEFPTLQDGIYLLIHSLGLSPHCFNTDDEIKQTLAILTELTN